MSKREGKKKHHKHQLVNGKLDITRSGIGYVIVEGVEKDIFIRPHDFGKAFHGDTVQISIKESNGKRLEGKVEEVVERKQTEFIGNIEVSENFSFFTPDSQKPMPDFYVSIKNLNGAKDKDRVVVRLLSWDDAEKKPEGEVVNILEAKDVNDMAMKEILIESGFPLEFSKEALNETSHLTDTADDEEIFKRKDCRDILTFTIDPVDAKDFDDAISIRKLKNDNYEIGVHIADVSHFVKTGMVLDETAYERATSVYLPDRVNPMLPEKISNELCSLRPNEDKFTFSAIFQINNKGEVKNYWLGKTIMHSDRRFTYEEVQEIIEKKEGDHQQEILLLNDLAQQFRKKRLKNGAINFYSKEVRFTLDEQEKLKPFVAFARKFGYKFDLNDEAAVASSFNQMLKDVQGRPEQHVLEQLGIRTMAKAIYTSENIGHYGLGFEHYCHFTSPIRRYPDILVHRVLEELLEKNVRPDKKMEEKCKHCSEKSALQWKQKELPINTNRLSLCRIT